jgi:hypothetical protein
MAHTTTKRSRSLKISILSVSVLVVIMAALSISVIAAENEIEMIYYTAAVAVLEDDEVSIRPDILTSLQPGESWSSLYNDLANGFYIIKVTATSSRQRELVKGASEIDRTLGNAHNKLEDQPEYGIVYSSVWAEWNRLKALGCTVPLRAIEIVGSGDIRC